MRPSSGRSRSDSEDSSTASARNKGRHRISFERRRSEAEAELAEEISPLKPISAAQRRRSQGSSRSVAVPGAASSSLNTGSKAVGGQSVSNAAHKLERARSAKGRPVADSLAVVLTGRPTRRDVKR